jgi:membrane protein
MARLRQVPHAIRSVGVIRFGKNLGKRIADDDLTVQAAAVAYAWLFAVFPFLIFLVTLSAYLPKENKDMVVDRVNVTIHQIMQRDAAETITKNLQRVLNEPRGGLLSVGLLVTLWVASGGMRMTMSGLDTAYDAKRRRPFWYQWPLALLLTIVVAVMIAAVLVLLPIGPAVEAWMARSHPALRPVLFLFDVGRMVLSVVLVLAFLSLVYQYGTVVRHPFAFVSPGAVFTMVVWFALGAGFRIYIDKFGSYQKTYGALGGVAILLLFFYLDALVLLVGAEINSQVDECCAADKQPVLFPPEVPAE